MKRLYFNILNIIANAILITLQVVAIKHGFIGVGIAIFAIVISANLFEIFMYFRNKRKLKYAE